MERVSVCYFPQKTKKIQGRFKTCVFRDTHKTEFHPKSIQKENAIMLIELYSRQSGLQTEFAKSLNSYL